MLEELSMKLSNGRTVFREEPLHHSWKEDTLAGGDFLRGKEGRLFEKLHEEMKIETSGEAPSEGKGVRVHVLGAS